MLLIHQATEQQKKWECLKSAIDRGKVHKWMHERVDKASDETINKPYALYNQRELNQKGEETTKALAKVPLIYILVEFLVLLKSGMLTNYGRPFKMTRSSKIRWSTLTVFKCMPLVIILRVL